MSGKLVKVALAAIAVVGVAALALRLATVADQKKVALDPGTYRLTENSFATYDKFDDETLVFMPWQRLFEETGASTDLYLGASFTCSGNHLSAPKTCDLVFQYRGTDWDYLRGFERGLVFMAGAKRMPFTVMAHDGKVGEHGTVAEDMIVSISADSLLMLFEGNAQGKLGRRAFNLADNMTKPVLLEFAGVIRTLRSGALPDSLKRIS